jgi:hypothetical protein
MFGGGDIGNTNGLLALVFGYADGVGGVGLSQLREGALLKLIGRPQTPSTAPPCGVPRAWMRSAIAEARTKKPPGDPQ